MKNWKVCYILLTLFTKYAGDYMTEKEQFKQSVIRFNNAKKDFEKQKRNFKFNVIEFMRNKGIPVRVSFYGDTFGIDIRVDVDNWREVPRKIPLDVLTDFCNEFGCEFEYTNSDGERYIFSFNGLSIGFNIL